MDQIAQGSARILIADQDKTLNDRLEDLFNEHGYRTATCRSSGAELFRKLEQGVDLLLLDCAFSGCDLTGCTLPDCVSSPNALPSSMNDRNVWRLLAERGHSITMPVILMSGERSACIEALRQGADDFIAKPFEPLEALLRAEALLRRRPVVGIRCDRLTLGPLRLSRNARSVYFANKPIILTAVQFKLLWYLAEHHDQLLSKSWLHQWVLDKPYCRDDRSIDMHLSRIRKKLLAAGMAADALQTVRARGYRLTLFIQDEPQEPLLSGAARPASASVATSIKPSGR